MLSGSRGGRVWFILIHDHLKVHDNIFCCRSGSAADTQAIADIVSYYLNLHRYQRDGKRTFGTRNIDLKKHLGLQHPTRRAS